MQQPWLLEPPVYRSRPLRPSRSRHSLAEITSFAMQLATGPRRRAAATRVYFANFGTVFTEPPRLQGRLGVLVCINVSGHQARVQCAPSLDVLEALLWGNARPCRVSPSLLWYRVARYTPGCDAAAPPRRSPCVVS
jgi:hypothetical protein